MIYSQICPYFVREANFIIEFFNMKGKVAVEAADEIDWHDVLSGTREKLRDIKSQNRLQ
jgi:hypothetical protein